MASQALYAIQAHGAYEDVMSITCSICERDTPEEFQSRHHLVPKVKHGKETSTLCIDCGKQIHQLFTNSDLKNKYNTIEALLSNSDIQKWVQWVKKRPFGVSMKNGRRW